MKGNLPAPLVDKLGKLIPRLASDHDGEVLGTVAAIRRTLAAQRLDLHDLVRSLEEPRERVTVVYRDRLKRADPEYRPLAEWMEIADCCETFIHFFSTKERAFIRDMYHRLRAGQRPTPKQGAWLLALHRRFLGAGE